MLRKTPWLGLLAAWAGVCLAQGTTVQSPARSAPAGATAPAPAGPAATPASRPVLERLDIRAQLMPRRYTTIAAEIGAKIAALPVPEGGAFRAGQLLVTYDCVVQRAQTDRAQAEWEAANQTLQANQRMEVLQAVGQLEVELSRTAVNKARAELNAQTAMLAKCEVTAPFAGRVAEQRVREQQYVQAGQPLLDILDDSVLELEFLVPSVWLRWVKPGGAFEVQIDETRKTYPARFTRLGARVDPVSQSVKAVAAIHGRFPELMAGMSGRVLITPPSAQ